MDKKFFAANQSVNIPHNPAVNGGKQTTGGGTHATRGRTYAARVRSKILANSGQRETSMLSAVPTGLEIPASVPTDKSVGYFHLSLRDKMHIYRKVGMHPAVNRWQHTTRPVYGEGRGRVGMLGGRCNHWLRLCYAGLLALVLISMGLTGCSKDRQEMAEKLPGKEATDEKSSGKSTQEEAGADLLKLDKHAQELAGIKTVVIKRETIAKVVEFPAEIDFDQTRIFAISCPIDGKVVKVNCNQGDTIKPGDTLAEIENPQTIGQIFKVNASCNGFVTRRYINPALWVTRGGTLFEAVDTSRLWGIIHLYPEEAQEIRTGQKVFFVFSDGAQSLEGEIDYISPSIDPTTRTIEARATIGNHGNIRAHTYVVVQVITDEKANALVIPESAVFPEDFGQIVFTMENDTFKKRVIETGIKRNGKVEVLQGLEAGNILVTDGAYQLKNVTFQSHGDEEEGELEGR